MAEDIGLVVIAQRRAGKDVVDRRQLPGIGIVAFQHDLVCADLGGEVPDLLRREDQRVEIDLFEVFRRRGK